MSTTATTAPQTDREVALAETVDRLKAKLNDTVDRLAREGAIPIGSNLVHSAICINSDGDRQVDWVLDNGDVYTTRSQRRDFTRPLAPVIPSAVKKLRDLLTPDSKAMAKARDTVRESLRGFFATLETRLARTNPSRTLPGMSGKQYSTNAELAEYQKYADAGEKIGLG